MKFYQIFVYDFFLTVDPRRLQPNSINVSVVVWYPTGKQSSAESTWKSSCPARIQAQKIACFRELQEYSFFNRSVIVIKYFVETYLRFVLQKVYLSKHIKSLWDQELIIKVVDGSVEDSFGVLESSINTKLSTTKMKLLYQKTQLFKLI